MTYSELSQYRFLNQKISLLEEEKKAIIKFSPSVDGMPHGKGNKSDPVAAAAEKRIEIENKINALKDDAINRIAEIEKVIDDIPEEEMKLIFRYRFILCYSYEKIGELLYMDRTTIARKLKIYIKNIHKI